MEKISEKFIKVQSKAHFRSNTYINLETTGVKKNTFSSNLFNP